MKGSTSLAFLQCNATSERLGGNPSHFHVVVLIFLSMVFTVHVLTS